MSNIDEPTVQRLIHDHVHLTEEQFGRYLDRSLPADVRPGVEAHLQICFECASEINTAIDALEFPMAKLPLPPDPATLALDEDETENRKVVFEEASHSGLGIIRRVKELLISRRQANVRLACALIGVPVFAAIKPFVTADIKTQDKLPLTRMDLLSDLFKPSGRVACFAGDSMRLETRNLNQWDAWKGHGFPHCRLAVKPYTNLFEDAVEVTESDQEMNLEDLENIFSTGSPHASSIARQYLPFWDDRDGTFSRGAFVDPSAIPYHIAILKEEGWRSSASLGRADKEALKTIRVGSKEYSVGNEPGKYLRSDFLLITRLPKKGGGHIILVAGGHGAGTRSFEMLFNAKAFSDLQLRELHRVIGGKESFQLVFKCSELTHDGTTIAHKVEVWDEVPPVEINPQGLRFDSDLI